MHDLLTRMKAALAERYSVTHEIGRGGMATVFHAEDLKHGRSVAVKVLQPELASAITADRFLREIQIAAQLQHPHIVPLYDSGEADGFLYFVMPFVEGETLRARMSRERQLPLDTSLQIAREVASALEYAHRSNVVHRDIKPENILLSFSGGHAMVADFGIAFALTSASGEALTKTGIAIGTPAYMSPEQAGAESVDARSDIYSLGCVLYEMLAGQPPYIGPTAMAILAQHAAGQVTPPGKLRGDVPKNVERAVLKALASKPADRHTTAGEFAQHLSSPAVRPAHRKWARLKSRKAILTVAALATLAAAALLHEDDLAGVNPRRVAVTVFENKTGDPSLDPVGSMAADWITQGLQQTGFVELAPSSTVQQVSISLAAESGSGGDPIRALAKRTRAGTVISGAFYRLGDSLQFQAQITDARAGRLLGRVEPVSGPVDNPLDAVERLRREVTSTLAAVYDWRLGVDASETRQPPNFEAYQAFAEGQDLYWRGQRTGQRRAFEEAVERFYAAAELDSSFMAPSLLRAAWTHMTLGQLAEADSLATIVDARRDQLTLGSQAHLDLLISGFLRADRASAIRIARESGGYDLGLHAFRANHPAEAVKALQRAGPGGWSEYWFILTASYHLLGDHKAELKAARKARNDITDRQAALRLEVRALAALGRMKDLSKRLDESLTTPPGPNVTPAQVVTTAGAELRAHGNREAGLAVIQRAIDWYRARPPEEQQTRRHQGRLTFTYYVGEQWDEARAGYERLAAEFPDNMGYFASLGFLAARRGDREEALRISEALPGMAGPYNFGLENYYQANIAALLGERERAVRLLRETYNKGRPWSLRPHVDLDFDSLHDYPPFQEFIKPKG